MKILTMLSVVSILLGVQLIGVTPVANAATSPDLGAAKSFVILSDTYTNTVAGTTLTGDLGYTTPPAVAPTVNGTTFAGGSTYNQAGIDQNTALSNLNSQPCTFNFAPGAIDLASDTTHGPVGVYTPGVYCITGGDSVGGGGTITLSGVGTYIFRVDGALSTSANSIVTVANGASICDVWWTPTQATTLGADSTFLGTVIAASGNTVGNNVNWTGRALSFGGTISTAADTITAPNCQAATVKTPGLPNTGLGEQSSNTSSLIISAAAVVLSITLIALIRKNA
ncbi:MAG: ice-binding family protein [bacterium]|nr:ice-binding family protein [bacterium]